MLDAAQKFVPADKQQYVTVLRDKGGHIYYTTSYLMGKYGKYL